MKQTTFKLASFAILSFASMNALADENGIKGAGEFGFTKNTGNTESQTVLGALKIDYIQPVYELKSAFSVNNKSESNVQTQERYVADLQYNRFYAADKSYYSFAQARFEKDEFADLKLDSLYTLGLGKTLIKNEKSILNSEAGIGFQTTDYKTAEDEDQMVLRLKADYAYQINEHVAFTQDAIVYSGGNQTKLETNSGLKVALAGDLNLKAGFQYRHNSDPGADAEKTDTQTTLTMIYDF